MKGSEIVWPVPTGAQIRALREESGMSLPQFATNFGFDTATLDQWEHGKGDGPQQHHCFMLLVVKRSLIKAVMLVAELKQTEWD